MGDEADDAVTIEPGYNPSVWRNADQNKETMHSIVRTDVEDEDIMHLIFMFGTGLDLDWQDYTGE